MVGVVWGARRNEVSSGEEGGLDGRLKDRRRGTAGEIPGEWQCVSWLFPPYFDVAYIEINHGKSIVRFA